MATIGTFTTTANGFTGTIKTLRRPISSLIFDDGFFIPLAPFRHSDISNDEH